MTTILEFRWTTSKARDSYGYNVCTLFVDGRKVARCNGGGYDMKGTCLGNWIADAYRERLLALKEADMPENSHWERAENPRRWCENAACMLDDPNPLPHDCLVCPRCHGETRIDYHDGKRVNDGRYFYALTFHDPNYNASTAIVGKDCQDRTLGANENDGTGLTVAQAEEKGISLGLERLQATYNDSSKVPTDRHTVPQIDGACGWSSVERIAKAIGLSFQWIPTKSKKTDLYQLHDQHAEVIQ